MQRRDSNSSQSSTASAQSLTLNQAPSILSPSAPQLPPPSTNPASSDEEDSAPPESDAAPSDPTVWALIPPSLAAQLSAPPSPPKDARPPKAKNWRPNVRRRVRMSEVLEDYGSEDELPGGVVERLCMMGSKRTRSK